MERLCLIVGASEDCVHALRDTLRLHKVRAVGVSNIDAAMRLFVQVRVDAVVLDADAFGELAFETLRALVKQRCASRRCPSYSATFSAVRW